VTELGCQIFLGAMYQKGKKYTTLPQKTDVHENTPNGCYDKIYQMAVKYTKCP
jgi:hypothetical protein